MAVCPRCNANVPDGTERCLVCGYGLPGTVAESEDPKSPETADSSGSPAQGQTTPGGVELPATTGQVYSRDTDPAFGVTGTVPAFGAESDRTSVLQAPADEPPSRQFPFNAVLVAVVAAIAIALLVLALSSGSGSGGHPANSTSTTSKSHNGIGGTTTTSSTTTTTSPTTTTTTTTTTSSTTTTTTARTTTTTVAPTTTTVAPTTTTTASSTTTTTAPKTTTTTTKVGG